MGSLDEYDSHSLRFDKQGPSLGKKQVKIPHQRSPYAIKIEDRSQEETERQERCAHDKVWNIERNIDKLKEKDKATFYSSTIEWIMPAALTIKPEERSGASMRMVSKRDLNSTNLEPMRMSKNPTTVMTANGEVQTREEAPACVKELDLFVTVQFSHSGNSAKIMGVPTTRPVVKNHNSPKMARQSIAL